MNYKAVIFDLDGTLLDTLEDIALSVNEVLKAEGFSEHPLDAYRFFVGDGMDKLVQRAFPEGSLEGKALAGKVETVKAVYRRRWAENTRPYPGVPEMLTILEKRGIPKAIFSNKPQEFTQITVETLLPHWAFEAVYGIGPDIPRKPDPHGALLIAGMFGVNPNQIVYLGDTSTDMKTALAAKMHPVGALWGFRSGDELQAAGAGLLLPDPRDLISLFNGEKVE